MSQVAESASSDCKWHCILVYFFLSSPPGYCCKMLRDSNKKIIYKYKKIKKIACDITRGSASVWACKCLSVQVQVCSQTLLPPAGREFIRIYKSGGNTGVCLQTSTKSMLQNCFEKVLRFWPMYYYYELDYYYYYHLVPCNKHLLKLSFMR